MQMTPIKFSVGSPGVSDQSMPFYKQEWELKWQNMRVTSAHCSVLSTKIKHKIQVGHALYCYT